MSEIEFDYWYAGPRIDPVSAVTEALSFVPDGWAPTGNEMGKWAADTETYGYGSSATTKTTWRVCVTVWASEGQE